MTIIKPGVIPTKIEPKHVQISCIDCGCIFDATEKEGLLTVLSDGIKEKPLYRSYRCPTCGKRIKVCLEMFKEA